MTPKQKANELMDAMLGYNDEYHHSTQYVAKKCALIMVEEIIQIVEDYEDALELSQSSDIYEFWVEVKKEIEKI